MEVLSNIEEREKKPMSNDEIMQYFPDSKIISEDALYKCNHISDLLNLKNFVSHVIILYQLGNNYGHWVAISKFGDYNDPKNCFIEYFDSFGSSPSKNYNYFKKNRDVGAGQTIKDDYISKLLRDSPYNVIYNKFKFQGNNKDIATCGRHCCFRIIQLLRGMDLPEYINYMKDVKDITGKTYDQIVTEKIIL